MRIIEGSSRVPVIYSAHHASHDFGEFSDCVALTNEQKIRFSDYGTEQTVPLNGLAAVIAERSRALGDLNRDPDDPGRFQEQDYAKPTRHQIWKKGLELNEADKKYADDNFYKPFHDKLLELLRQRDQLTFVVAWDNTAHYEIGRNESGDQITMKPFILSNRGKEESALPTEEEPVSCDPRFMELLAKSLAEELKKRSLPSEIHLNLVYKGGYVCSTYSTARNRKELEEKGITAEVQSLQIEYDTAITHDQETLEFHPDKAEAVREAFSNAIEKTYLDYTKKAEK